ncbi:MAG TPA: beta-ketoacyl-ACP synthase III [Thermoanaerobaculia bacterium]|jgi:3-oxoacyl-[acyl-carrier-protein] synthase-3|nr:beta-ketoacyl-ACP synthase III [Thermoanaerobaculia bacterium]HPA52541.1 beta-ketoacyl-ACP synthase III [Thermoanaerobaculia bacterium]HQN09752.1 beta-ketoacyl-ACP synthase III [Thermoanaerobaculia bacterium]HQP86945.1 beta-ketoacyl-ACP synthase III [Thermoanaerobaculia bacterium]
MFHAAIAGTGRAVPAKLLTNADLETLVETTDEWITTRTGIRERHQAAEGEVLSDFCVEAAKQALEAAWLQAKDLDAILIATVTPDQPIPSMACLVQQKLGAKKAAAWDQNAGCSGWLYGLHIADGLIQAGKARNVLLVGAEFLTRYVDYTDRATCVLFGDGAGATILRATKSDRGVLASTIRSDGEGACFIQMPGGGSSFPPTRPETLAERLPFIKMMGGETFKLAVRSMVEVCKDVLNESGFEPGEVSWLVPHQANDRIIQAVGERLGIPRERCIVNIERYGNTSAASIPIALDEAARDGRVKRGDLILFTAFGAGLTWGAALVRW